MLFFDDRRPRYAWPVLAESERVSQKIELPFRNPADSCLLLVHHQLQLAHDLAQSVQCLFGFALSAQDHKIIRVGHDTRAAALLLPSFFHPSTNRRM
jgi:hypothetical protein